MRIPEDSLIEDLCFVCRGIAEIRFASSGFGVGKVGRLFEQCRVK